MPRRRWRTLERAVVLTAAEKLYLETGALPDSTHPEYAGLKFFDAPRLARLWQQFGLELTREWARRHDGARPWAWSKFGPPA